MRTPVSALPNARRPVIFVETVAGAAPVLTAAQTAGLSSFAHVVPMSFTAFQDALTIDDDSFGGFLINSLENVVVVGVAPAGWAALYELLASQNFQACYVAGAFFNNKRLVGTVVCFFPTAQLLNAAIAAAIAYVGPSEEWEQSAYQDLGTFAGVYSLTSGASGLLSQAYTYP